MKIVGGELGGRRFSGPPSNLTRPTSERVREALFSALQSRDMIEGAIVFDPFAGTGALSFEALSRGATRAVLVDKNRRVVNVLKNSAQELGLVDHTQIVCADALNLRQISAHFIQGAATLVFVDPPYDMTDRALEAMCLAEHRTLFAPNACFAVEYATRSGISLPAALAQVASYRYGDTSIALAAWTKTEQRTP